MKCRLLYTHVLGIVFDYADLSKITDFFANLQHRDHPLRRDTFAMHHVITENQTNRVYRA